MAIGRPDSWLSYPEKQALYPVSVRHNKCLSTASFGFPVTRDTLAFDYKIPAITALLGLEINDPAPFRLITCPAHQRYQAYGLWVWSCMSVYNTSKICSVERILQPKNLYFPANRKAFRACYLCRPDRQLPVGYLNSHKTEIRRLPDEIKEGAWKKSGMHPKIFEWSKKIQKNLPLQSPAII